MTTILPTGRSAFDVIGQSIGANLERTLPQAATQRSNREALQASLSQIGQIASNPNSSNLDIMLSAMKAGAGIPGSEKYLGAIMPELIKFAEAKRAQNIPTPAQSLYGQQQSPQVIGQPQNVPDNIANMGAVRGQNEFFPTNVGKNEAPGHAHQVAETTRKKLPVATPDEVWEESKKSALRKTQNGQPTTPEQEYEHLSKINQDRQNYNDKLEEQISKEAESQLSYGKRGVEHLKNVYSGPTKEIEAIFQKKGEKAASKGQSEADINRYLAKEAEKFSNIISNVKNDLSPPRAYNIPHRKLLGTYKSLEQTGADMRKHLQPLLDIGLYDTARNILSEKGFYPEEVASILQPLNERSKSIFTQVPIGGINEKGFNRIGSPEQRLVDINNIKDTFRQLKQSEPNFSLSLARKQFEDKNYDWRLVKDALNELEDEGFILEGDQNIQKSVLDTPPLNALESILYNVNLQGR